MYPATFRIAIRNGSQERLQHLKEVLLRSHVVLQLGYLLVERRPLDVVGRPASFVTQERFRSLQRSYASALEATYP